MTATNARKLALPVFLAFLAGPVLALTVSVVPAEGKAFSPPPDGSGSPLAYLVSGCMDALFDAGYVVTDADVVREPSAAWGASDAALGAALAGAKEGLVDYVVALYVDWAPSGFLKDTLLPAAVKYRVLRVADGVEVVGGELRGSPDSEEAARQFAQVASQAGTRAALPCLKFLKALAMGGER
jgi:hypothetical protein